MLNYKWNTQKIVKSQETREMVTERLAIFTPDREGHRDLKLSSFQIFCFEKPRKSAFAPIILWILILNENGRDVPLK